MSHLEGKDEKESPGRPDAKGSMSMDSSSRMKGEDPEFRQPRRPRRERHVDTTGTSDTDAAAQDKGNVRPPENDVSPVPGKPRRKRLTSDEGNNQAGGGGWMMSPTRQQDAIEEEVDEPTDSAIEQNKDKFFEEKDDEIMIIPDLDEDGFDEDARIAHAPRNISRKIPTLIELENEVTAAIPSVEDGLDLGVLLRTLVPASMVLESDVPWTFETLLRDVTDELTAPTKTVLDPNSAEFAEATKGRIKSARVTNKNAKIDTGNSAKAMAK